MFQYTTEKGKFELFNGEITFMKRNDNYQDILSIGVKEGKKQDDKPTYLTAFKETADRMEKFCKKGDTQAFLCYVKENGQYTNYNINRAGDFKVDVTTDKGKDLTILKGLIVFVSKKEKFLTIGVKTFGKDEKPVYLTFDEKEMSKVEQYCIKNEYKIVAVTERVQNGEYTNYYPKKYSFEKFEFPNK